MLFKHKNLPNQTCFSVYLPRESFFLTCLLCAKLKCFTQEYYCHVIIRVSLAVYPRSVILIQIPEASKNRPLWMSVDLVMAIKYHMHQDSHPSLEKRLLKNSKDFAPIQQKCRCLSHSHLKRLC